MLPQVIFVIILAALLAAGLFLAIPYLQGREAFPAGTYTVNVEDLSVIVEADPAMEVYLIPLTQGGSGGQSAEVAPQQQEPETFGGPAPAPTATFVVLPTAGPAPTLPPVGTESIIFIDYVVQPGDTLYSISLRQDTSIALMARFGISSTSLVPGAVIRLPIGNPAHCPSGWVPYAVEEGQTAFSIASKCGVPLATFSQVNGLDANNTIYAASIVCVPIAPLN